VICVELIYLFSILALALYVSVHAFGFEQLNVARKTTIDIF